MNEINLSPPTSANTVPCNIGESPELQHLESTCPNRVEWKYEMRRQAQETLPGVFVGPFQPSWSLPTLRSLGITHILCIAESREQHLFRARFPDLFTYCILEVRDADDQNLIKIFPQAIDFIDSALTSGGKVLVHCGDGISRSPAVVTAYVMCKANLSPEDAFLFVQARRFCVAPRIEFQHQLEAFKPIYLASAMMARDSGAQLSGQRANRRARDEEDVAIQNGGAYHNGDSHMDETATIHGGRSTSADFAPLIDPDMVQRIPQWPHVDRAAQGERLVKTMPS